MDPNNLTRIDFWELFSQGVNGAIIVKKPFVINGLVFNEGLVVPPGSLLAGVDFHQRKGIPIALVKGTNPPVIYGFYTNP